jgi:hypothetical protein
MYVGGRRGTPRFHLAIVVVAAFFAFAHPLCGYGWFTSSSSSRPNTQRYETESEMSVKVIPSSTCQKVSSPSRQRRQFVLSTVVGWPILHLLEASGTNPVVNAAVEEMTTTTTVYTRQQSTNNNKQHQQVSYSINLPSSMKETSKPVKTHLDEVNFVSDGAKGYQYGITVDPVRISSLQEVRTST